MRKKKKKEEKKKKKKEKKKKKKTSKNDLSGRARFHYNILQPANQPGDKLAKERFPLTRARL